MPDDPAKALLRVGIKWGVVLVVLVLIGVTVSGTYALLLAIVFGVFALLGSSSSGWFSREISVPFVLSAVAILTFLAEFILPDWFVSRVPDFGGFLGIPFAELDALTVVILSLLAILAIWGLEIRFTGRAVKPETVAKRMKTKAEKLVDTYLTIGRLVAALAVTIVFMTAAQSAQLLGEVGAWIGEVPFIASSIGISLSGYLSLGGTLPVVGWSVPLIGSMTAGDFAVFAVLLIAFAAAVAYND